jgi:cobalamin biosynthesis protein CbiD
MFGVEFFVAFGIGMPSGAMTIYHYMRHDIRRTFDKMKKGI